MSEFHHPTPLAGTPIAPLSPPVPAPMSDDTARAAAEMLARMLDPSVYDEAWGACSTDTERLHLISGRVRTLLADYTATKAITLEAHKTTHAKLDAIAGQLEGLGGKRKRDRKQIALLRREVIALNKEVGKLVTAISSTMDKQLQTAFATYETATEVDEVSQRLGQLERQGSRPSVPASERVSKADLTTTLNDKTGTLRAEAHAPEPPGPKLAPGLSIPPQRQPAMVGDVMDVERRVEQLEHSRDIAGRGDGWTKRQIALLAVVMAVAGFFGRAAFEWVTRAPSATPAALARPIGSGAP